MHAVAPMNVFSFFLLLFALMAALAKSWRYACAFALMGVALEGTWMGLDYLSSRPPTAREILATCDANRYEDGTYSATCIAEIWTNLVPSGQKDGRCVYDVAFFKTDRTTIDPRFADMIDYEQVTVMAVEWMQSHPEQLDLPGSDVISNAIASRFPCPANPN